MKSATAFCRRITSSDAAYAAALLGYFLIALCAIGLTCTSLGCSGAPQVVYQTATTGVRLAEPIKAHVWVELTPGVWTKSVNPVQIPEGFDVLPPPPLTKTVPHTTTQPTPRPARLPDPPQPPPSVPLDSTSPPPTKVSDTKPIEARVRDQLTVINLLAGRMRDGEGLVERFTLQRRIETATQRISELLDLRPQRRRLRDRVAAWLSS